MDRLEVGNIGLDLADDLNIAASTYHVKSDKHEILCYESAGVQGMSEELLTGAPYRYELSESTLLSEWGSILAQEIPDLFNRVRKFRSLYQSHKHI